MVFVTEKAPGFPCANLSRPDYDDWKRLNTPSARSTSVGGTGFLCALLAEPVPAARVGDGFFQTLGVRCARPRLFAPAKIAWPRQNRHSFLGALAEALRRTHRCPWPVRQPRRQRLYDRRGFAARLLLFPARQREFWVPLLDPTGGCEARRSCHNLDAVGRLRDGVTVEAARKDMERIAAQLGANFPDSNRQGAFVQPLREIFVGDMQPILLMLLAGAALLLLIACVNVSSLLLVRSEAAAAKSPSAALSAPLPRASLPNSLRRPAAGLCRRRCRPLLSSGDLGYDQSDSRTWSLMCRSFRYLGINSHLASLPVRCLACRLAALRCFCGSTFP